jgi:hypothetical protein
MTSQRLVRYLLVASLYLFTAAFAYAHPGIPSVGFGYSIPATGVVGQTQTFRRKPAIQAPSYAQKCSRPLPSECGSTAE